MRATGDIHRFTPVFMLAVLLISAGSATLLVAQQSTGTLEARVDTLFSDWDRSDSPGCALGVIQDGELIYARGYGMADLEHSIPITPRSVFRIGSTSKQFTALCILLLEEEGKLSLDDDIHRFFPEIPEYPAPVTVRHLIHHTSGVRDYLTLMDLAGKRGDDFFTDEEVVAMIARQQELNFPPGDQHLYSNSGYFLLSQIVLRITGRSMREYAREKVFEPLGMEHTHFHDDHTEIVPGRASGYSPTGEGFRINMTTLGMIGDGGVFTTIEDLLLWDHHFYGDRVGRKDLLRKQHTVGILNDGTELAYAAGLTVSTYRGLRMVSHGGSFVGFRADMIRFPEQRFSVICLANLSSVNPSRLARQVADIYLAGEMEPIPQNRPGERQRPAGRAMEIPETLLLTDDLMTQYQGAYYSRELDVVYELVPEEGELILRVAGRMGGRVTLRSEDVLRTPGQTFNLFRDAQGAITGFRLNAGRVQNLRFDRRP